MSSQRLTIGFLIHHLDNDYSKALLKGAAEAAKELDVNLAIFPGRSLNSQLDDRKHTAFEYQYNVIYSFVSAQSLDAAVLSAGTLGSFVSKDEFKKFVDGFQGLPILTTENKVEGYPCVRMSSSGIKDLVRHLAQDHGRKRIAFVSGPRGNADADERLHCYIEALEENGLEYCPDLVAYGKFSEYCADLVGNLIDQNSDIDAICFANDMMCKGGYQAIESRGLRVGEDIAVTGYDDSEVAVSLKPMLTTVRADASRLGARAVREAVRLARGETAEDVSLGSAPVYRFSCGCAKQNGETDDILKKPPEDAANQILGEWIPRYEELLSRSAQLGEFRDYLTELFRYACGGREYGEIFAKSYFSRIIDSSFEKLIPAETLMNILKKAHSVASDACAASGCSAEKALRVMNIVSGCLETAAERIIISHYNQTSDIAFTHFLISNITKDMTIYGEDEEKCFFSIVNILYRVHLDSSYIYTYETPVINVKKSLWKLPKTIYLQAYHNGEQLTAMTGEARKLSSDEFLNNRYMPKDRRMTTVVSPLFINEEQYGIIVCELENKYFPLIYSITPQICTAIKLTNLVVQLESSLSAAESRNNMLNLISMSDELTGIYNRRGFYVFANRILKDPANEGRRAVLIYADLDNLKKINDSFGHEDGDYAIASAAGILKKSLRTSDVVARMGGDEFAAFAICDDKEIASHLPERIKSIARAHNQNSGKPYNITVSIGIYELICSPELNIQQFIDKADTSLYLDKKNKSFDILKHDGE